MKDMQETYPEIFVEKLGHRIVYLLKKEDRDLFLKVKEYELNHPGAINDAMHEFCNILISLISCFKKKKKIDILKVNNQMEMQSSIFYTQILQLIMS